MKDIKLKNKFLGLAHKLIGNKMWTSVVTLIQLKEEKTPDGRVKYIEDFRKPCNCVVKEISKEHLNQIPAFQTEIVISSKSLKEFNIDRKLIDLIYNDRLYSQMEIIEKGTLNNEHCVVSFLLRR